MAKNLRGIPTEPDDGSSPAPAPLQEAAPAFLPDQRPVAPAAPEAELELPDQKPKIEDTYHQVNQADPTHAAQVLDLAQRLNEPETYIDKNLSAVQKSAAAPPSSFFKQLEDQYPGTTEFLSDPKNMAVTHDDLANVAAHEAIIRGQGQVHSLWEDAKGLYQQAKTGAEAGLQSSIPGLAYRQALPDVTLDKDSPFTERIAAGATGLAADFIPMVGGGALGGLMGGPAGAAAGGFGFPAALKQAMIEHYKNGDVKNFSDVLDRSYQILKESTKQALVGLATAGAGGLAAKLGAGTFTKLGAEVATMTTAGKGVEGELPTLPDFAEGVILVGGMHGVQALSGHLIQAKRTEAAKDFYTALGSTAEATKLRERLPEKYQEMVANLTKDGPVEHVYIPGHEFESYFQSKNLDPDTVASGLGVGASLKEARATGGDVEIPLATWAAKVVGTEHYKGLADDIKFDPSDLTRREVKTQREGIAAQMQALADTPAPAPELDPSNAPPGSDASSQKIYDHISQQLSDAGLTAKEVESNSRLHEAFFTTLGKQLGVDPFELSQKFPLTVRASDKTDFSAPEEHVLEQSNRIEGTNVTVAEFGKKKSETPTEAPADPSNVTELPGSKILTNAEVSAFDKRIDELNSMLDLPDLSDQEHSSVKSELSDIIAKLEKSQKLAEAKERATAPQSNEKLDALKARYGDGRGTKTIHKAIDKAQDPKLGPYVSDPKIKGIGWAPNYSSEPTGVIGSDAIQVPHPAENGLSGHPEPLQWSDSKYGATKQLIEKHAAENKPLTINTSSDLVGRDDYIAAMPQDTTVRMHLLTQNDNLNRILFPGNPSQGRLMSAVEKLRAQGVKVEVVRPTPEQVIEAAGGIDTVAKTTGQSPESARQLIQKAIGLRAVERYEQSGNLTPGGNDATSGGDVSGQEGNARADGRPAGPGADGSQVQTFSGRLEGLPASSSGPVPGIRDAARAYAERSGHEYRQQAQYIKADPERGARIAQAFDQMAHAPGDPQVQAAYRALIDETLAQYQLIKETGIKLERITPDMANPYPNGSNDIFADIAKGHLWFFPTEQGFGTENAISDHPLLEKTSEQIDGHPLLANDVFRIVHDVFGHAKEGNGIGPNGEENAWQSHVRMYSDLAARAMTTETRGQNSWVNFGPHGEANRADPSKTVFADQKAGILPEWVMTEGMAPDLKAGEATHFQGESGPVDPRGQITFGDGRAVIDLFKGKDKSTFLHESGHFFLDVLGKVAAMDNAPDSVKEDHAALMKWLGVEPGESLERDHHEKFARAFETYLREGNAPSEKLKRAFFNFKSWLTTLYKNVRSSLGVELNDDVRGIMDRLLATDEEIKRASHDVGYDVGPVEHLPADVQRRIQDLQGQAREVAERALLKDQMAEITDKHTEFLEKERARLRDEAETQVSELPVFKASDEVVEKLTKLKDPGTIASRFLDEKLKSGEAAQFEVIAEQNGFASGEDMAHQIMTAGETGAREREISARVEAGMAPHAALKDTDMIRLKAMEAIHNEKATELLALERQSFADLLHSAEVKSEVSRRRRTEARLEAQAAKESAQAILADKPIKDSGNFRTYLTAERRAAEKSARALARKDFEAAATHKREQMLNHALAAEAMRNREVSAKALDYLSKPAKRGGDLMGAPYGFIRQVDQLLSRFGLSEPRSEDSASLLTTAKEMAAKGELPADIANATGMRLDQNQNWVPETLPDFVARVNENYRAMSVPDLVLGATDKTFKELKLKDLLDLKEAVRTIIDVGRQHDRFLSDFLKADMKDAAARLKTSIAENVGTDYADDLLPGSRHATKLKETLASLTELPGIFERSLDTILTTCHKFDGLTEGPAKEFIYRPFSQAEARKTARMKVAMERLDSIFAKHYEPDEFAAYKDTRINVDGRFFTKEQILSMALNWGNEGNRDRLMRGFGFDEAKFQEVFKNLGAKDWNFAQDVWNHIGEYWPDIAKLERDVSGAEPGRVKPAPFQNEHGAFEGGYYPIAYDFDKSSEAYQNNQTKDALYKRYSAAKAATDQGHTEARATTVTRPIRLSLDVLKSHHEDVIHDLEFRRAVIDVSRFLSMRDSREAIVNATGIKGYSALTDWVKSVAGGASEPLTMLDRASQWFRFKTTFFNLGYRIVSAPKVAIENMINISSEIGMSGAARAVKDYYMGDSGIHETVVAKSDFMRQRAEHLNRDISDINNKWRGDEQGALKKYAFFIHAYLDQGASFPLWADVYKRAFAEHGDQQLAVNQADESVKRTFMSGGAIDQPAILRGSEKAKAITTAYGYQSMMWNRFSTEAYRVSRALADGSHYDAAAIVARATIYQFIMPALTAALAREFLRNNQHSTDQDRDKRVATAFLEEGTPLKFVPVLRDIAPYMIKKAMGEQVTALHVTPLEEAAQTLIDPLGQVLHSAAGHPLGDRFPEQTVNAASLLFGVPKEVNDIAFNFIDWMNHKGELTWRDAISRKTKK